jgi:hypothetical protein
MSRLFKLSLVWWAAHLLLALPLAFAFWTWASGQTAFSPGTDVLISGINVATIGDLMKGDRVGIIPVVRSGAAIAALVAGLLTPFLIGGTLATFRSSEHRVLPALLAGAGQAPGALLLIWIVTRGLALLLGLGSAIAFSGLTDRVGGEFWEPGPIIGFLGGIGLAALVWWFFVAAGDAAMILRAEPEPVRALRAIGRGVMIVLRHPVRVAGIWLLRGVIPAGLVQALYLGTSDAMLTMPAAIIGLQQSIMVVRAMCRVSILGAERDLVMSLRPPARSAWRDENQVAPGQDGERQVQHSEDGQRPVQLEQVQEHGARDGEQLGDGQRGADAGVAEGHRDERVALGETEGGDPQVGEDPIKRL